MFSGNLSMSKTKHNSSDVKLANDQFGLFTDNTTGKSTPVVKFTWTNKKKTSVSVITYGATIQSIKLIDKDGKLADIVMGFDDMEGYLNPLNPYFGATVGRVANRIGHSTFPIDGQLYKVTANLGKFTLHGGKRGFDKVNWEYYVKGNRVIMSYLSKDGEEGFPGDLIVNIGFELTNDSQFLVEFYAYTTKSTYVNLTNHSYFNLAGHETGKTELLKHSIKINAESTTEVDKDSIPTGKLLDVQGTAFDLRRPTILECVIDRIPGYAGYDHNFCVNLDPMQEVSLVAKVEHPDSGRVMTVYSNQPGVQFYVSNHLPENPNDIMASGKKPESLKGKGGAPYYKHGALCLETQNYPDAPNHPEFPNAILRPGNIYKHLLIYKFGLE